ncbi:MAG TPA: gluconeogenesis factor YvcK family protein, partial [Chthonomonadaceae bacterium]|nr:gluconeogenesis factor YvcK family protein [Chthonomonadaceae bacterium]
MRVKRWTLLAFLGLLLFLMGMGVIIQAHPQGSAPLAMRLARWITANLHAGLHPGTLGVVLALVGAGICLFALGQLITSLTSVLDPHLAQGGLVEAVYQRRKLAQGQRIVVIGGGTGLSTMLRGLKRYSNNLTAVVTVSDDGGSSGKLRKQLNILPPGDIRNCLVALADSERQMTELFQYRFRNTVKANGSAEVAQKSLALEESGGYGEGLRDHAFGNLLIAAMCAINDGDFERAVRETSRVLNVRGSVLPSTDVPVKLRAEMEDGSVLEGETTIAHSPLKIKRISLLPGNACPLPDVLEAIEEADVIVLGPGSVFTSIIPNLLLHGIPEAIARSRAKKVYVCNVMTQPGETDGFSAYDHIQAIEAHARRRIFDYVLVNTGQPGQDLLTKYRKTGALLVEPDTDRIKAEGYRPIAGNFINQTDVVRHDASLLAEAIMGLLEGRRKNVIRRLQAAR